MAYTFQAPPGVLILLVRHGKTKLNNPSKPMVRGWKDEDLSPEGRTAIQLLAGKLAPYDPQSVVSSDFMRDSASAQILASRLGLSNVETDYDARTWDVGEFSGKPELEVNPAIEALYHRQWDTPPGSSESFDGFTKRWLNFLDRRMNLASIEGNRPAIVVTHGRNIALTDSHFNHKMPEDGLMPFAGSYAVLSVNPDQTVSCDIPGESECVCADV